MFLKFLYAPLLYPDMLWILGPVLVSIFLMELYFQLYPRDGLGYHRSLENTIFLVFIFFNIGFYIKSNFDMTKLITFIIFLLFSIGVAVLDFFHKLPLRFWQKIPAKAFVAYISYIFIVLIYSDILVNFTYLDALSMLASVILLFAAIMLIVRIFVELEPKSYVEIENFLTNVEEDLKKSKKKEKEHNK